MKYPILTLILASALALITCPIDAVCSEIDGVFGLSPIPQDAALVIWIPLDAERSISGVQWYNNDSSQSFPKITAFAGNPDEPIDSSGSIVVGEDISGESLSWSDFSFERPLASASSGLFLVFEIPQSGAFIGEGQGAGIGYHKSDGHILCWIATGPDDWCPIDPAYQMAIAPVYNHQKSGGALVLGSSHDDYSGPAPNDISIPEKVTLNLYAGPNPFNPSTTISYSVPSDCETSLEVFDISGKKIKTLVSGWHRTGQHESTWDGRDNSGHQLSSGVYLVKLQTGSLCLTKRITLVK